MSAEARLIVLAVTEDAGAEVSGAASAIRRCDRVAELAIEHRVSAFVRRALREVSPQDGGCMSRLNDSVLDNAASVELLTAELARIVQRLAGDGIPVIVLKGIALARSLYRPTYLRPFDDLDVAVAHRNFTRAASLLEESGYRRISSLPKKLPDDKPVDDVSFLLPWGGVVELRSDPLELGIPSVCEPERWARAEPLPGIEGALMLAAADQVVHLAVHAHKHGYNRLIWLKDLDLLLRSCDRLDWDAVVSTASREGVEAPVWYALDLTRRLLRTPIRSTPLASLRPRWPLQVLYRAIWSRRQVAELRGRSHWYAIHFDTASWSRMLPSLVLLNRRRHRGRALWEAMR